MALLGLWESRGDIAPPLIKIDDRIRAVPDLLRSLDRQLGRCWLVVHPQRLVAAR